MAATEVDKDDLEDWQRGTKKGRHPVWGNGRGYNVEKLTKWRKSLVSLWPLYRVRNITYLLYAHHKEKDTGL